MTNARTSSAKPFATMGYVVIGLLMALVICTVSACTFGHVSGLEFNPYTFDRRAFAYTEIPLIGVQVAPTTRTPKANKLQDWIGKNNAIVVDPDVKNRWDLVRGTRASRRADGDALILCEYLDARGDKGLVWLNWSNAHSSLARELWPRVAWLAQHELYYHIPALMDLAKPSERTPVEFVRQLDELLTSQVQATVDKLKNVDSQRASELRKHALAKSWTLSVPNKSDAPKETHPAEKLEADRAMSLETDRPEIIGG